MNYPEYDRDKYTIWALPHPLILHWVLNPGLAFNELIFGQRMPTVTLIDKTIDKPLMERTFVPCPHCGVFHEGRLWGKPNAFGHWFGYVCPSCGKIIPCLWNLTSLIILAITSPLWFIPVRLWKNKWIEYEKTRFDTVKTISYKEVPWVKMGFFFGGLMWLFLGFGFQLLWGTFSWQNTILFFFLCAIGGVLFTVIVKFWMGLRPNK